MHEKRKHLETNQLFNTLDRVTSLHRTNITHVRTEQGITFNNVITVLTVILALQLNVKISQLFGFYFNCIPLIVHTRTLYNMPRLIDSLFIFILWGAVVM